MDSSLMGIGGDAAQNRRALSVQRLHELAHSLPALQPAVIGRPTDAIDDCFAFDEGSSRCVGCCIER